MKQVKYQPILEDEIIKEIFELCAQQYSAALSERIKRALANKRSKAANEPKRSPNNPS